MHALLFIFLKYHSPIKRCRTDKYMKNDDSKLHNMNIDSMGYYNSQCSKTEGELERDRGEMVLGRQGDGM